MQVKADSIAQAQTGEVDALLRRAQALGAAGQAEQAAAALLAVLQVQSTHALANHQLGLLELQLGRAGALVRLATALKAAPEQEQFWRSYIGALIDAAEFDGARHVLALGRQRGLGGGAVDALEARLGPVGANDSAAVMALLAQGQHDQAFAQAQALAARFPTDPFGWKIQAAVQRMRGAPEAALQAMQRGVLVAPADAEAHANLGTLFNELQRFDEAERALRRALDLGADDADTWNSLGAALQGRPAAAEAAFRRALAHKADFPDALNNLAECLQSQGRLAEALPHYQSALRLRPDFHVVHSNLLFCLSQMDDIAAPALFEAHLAFGEAVEAPLRGTLHGHANSREAGRTIRIGFVTGDFRNHALASFIEPLLARLATRTGLEMTAYYNHTVHDSVTARLRAHMRGWRDIHGQDDAQVAERIRADGIDILIDLAGHTAFNRLPLFALKPAPVQVSWIGYPATTGLTAMDYYITDPFMLPPGQFDHQFIEKLVHLPVSAPFLPSPLAPPVNRLPALDNGYLTFGSFNRPSKLSRPVVALWSAVLRALPTSRMLLAAMPADGSEELVAQFALNGVARQRLDFHPRADMASYLALHQLVDVCLDTFPYSGGTTTLHALYMGVPTVTLSGATAAGRQGASIMRHSGLPQYIASSAAEFVAIGTAQASDLDTLAHTRASLRERFITPTSGAMEGVALATELALRAMWERWCAQQPPAPLQISLPQSS
jgi:predicted O-linked N-acetylglucosamine transferase (SPINDLY family)